MGAERASPFEPLKYPTFRAFWLANVASSFGGLIQGVGAAWLMTSLTSSVDLVALVQAANTLPIMLLSIVGGALADSLPRRRVLLATQSFMLVISLALAAITWAGLITPWLLLLFTFLVGCGVALNNPSWQTAVGDTVPRADIGKAVALNALGFNLSRSMGPAVGGIIVAVAGAAAAFAVNAVSYIGFLIVLVTWKPPPSASGLPRESMGAAMRAGLRYVAMSPQIGRVLIRASLFGITASSIMALLPVVASVLIGGGPLIYGMLLGAFGIGAIGGALMSSRLAERLTSEWIIRLTCSGFAVAALVTGLNFSPWLTAVALAVAGACWVTSMALFNVTVQLSTPRWVVGRALSIYQMCAFGGMALGSWMWGVIGEQFGVQTALFVSSGSLVGVVLVGLWVTIPPRVMLDLDPANRWQEPNIGLDIERRSGPIIIEIEYRIKAEDNPEFMRVMSARKRVRRRDGARDWSLRRDLHDPELWSEAFQIPTWLEYIRLNQRLTHADEVIGDRLRSLHQGPTPPRVRRMIERPPNWFAAVSSTNPIGPH